jgi:solute carrier family 39 (zinc transporter), member 1/2/3
MGVHVAAVFVLLVASFLGVATPTICRYFGFAVDALGIQCIKLFGAGILISTALVHMLLPATQALGMEECLPEAFHEYEAYPSKAFKCLLLVA